VTAVWLVLRAEFRARWRTWLMLALIAGIFAGAVQAAAAGARRTDSAYPDLLAWSDAPDVLLFSFPGPSRTFGQFSLAAAARLPQVTQSTILANYTVATPANAGIIAPEANTVPAQFWHRKILAGRLPDPGRPGEVSISFTLAQASHLGVGDILRVKLRTATHQLEGFSFRVVGIDAAPAEFPPQSGTGTDFVWATPAFYRAHHSGLDVAAGLALRLRHGLADLPAVQRQVSRMARGKFIQSYPLHVQAANTEHSIHLQAVALWLLSGLLGVIGLLILGQLLARVSFLDSVEYATLRALGMGRRALFAVGLSRAAVIGAAGGAAGALLAVAVSPLLPVGLAEIAEPHPGIDADVTVLGLGVAATVVATMAGAAWPTWRATRAGRARSRAARAAGGRARPASAAAGRGARLAAAATSAISSVTAVIGLRLALQPGAGRTALPVRSTIASAVVGVAALSAALVFTASLSNLLATPRLYGVTWDAYVSNTRNTGIGQAARGVVHDPAVAAWAVGYTGAPLTIRGVAADSIALLPGHHASLLPVLRQGHLPRGPGEIAVGARTLAVTHAHLGQTVAVSLGSFRAHRLKVVGTAVFPTLGDVLGLGKGATLTVGGLRTLLPPSVPPPPLDTLLVRFRPPAAGGQAGLNDFATRMGRLGPFVTQGPAAPTDVVNFGRVQQLPLLLGIALSLLALLTIAHLLLTSVRRRRRDFAVLRSLGFTRWQVRGAVGWQASALTVGALCLGIPAGIVCGRVAWRIFALQLGIPPTVVVPLVALAVLIPAGLALAVAIAAVPGESAARARPAEILRSE
jgi:ABC-type lipoprotein release transport system permease subunit